MLTSMCSILNGLASAVGGRAPGSFGGDATDIFQEGLRLPPVKLYERGEPNRAVLDTFLRYHHEQGLSKRRLQPEDLFAPETLASFKI